MNKRFLFSVVLLTLSAVLMAPVAALPPGPYYYWGRYGTAIVTLPGLPTLMIEALDIKVSTPIAPHDSLAIYIWDPISPMPLVCVTDNIDCAELLTDMFSFLPWFTAVFVDEGDLEIWSWVRRVTVVLNVPVDGVMPDGTGVVIPSFTMKLVGGGRGEWVEETRLLPYHTMWVGMWAYRATVKVVTDGVKCPAEEAGVGYYKMIITANP